MHVQNPIASRLIAALLASVLVTTLGFAFLASPVRAIVGNKVAAAPVGVSCTAIVLGKSLPGTFEGAVVAAAMLYLSLCNLVFLTTNLTGAHYRTLLVHPLIIAVATTEVMASIHSAFELLKGFSTLFTCDGEHAVRRSTFVGALYFEFLVAFFRASHSIRELPTVAVSALEDFAAYRAYMRFKCTIVSRLSFSFITTFTGTVL